MQNKQVTTKLPSQMSLIVRLMIAAYLLYTVFSLGDVWNRYSGGELILYMAAMAVFTVVALVMGFFSLRDLVCGKYFGGAKDDSSVEEEKTCEKEELNTENE